MSNIQTRTNLSKYFTVLIIAYPILSLYSVMGSPVSLSNILLVVALIGLFLNTTRNSYHNKASNSFFLPFYVYIIMHLLLILLIKDNINYVDTIGSTLRFLLNLTPLVFFVGGYFDYKLGIKVYRTFCLISVYYALTQFILHYALGLYLPGYISTPVFPVINHQISEFEDNMMKSWFTVFRPRSFFAEPAHFAEYILGYYTLCLFGECDNPKQRRKDIITVLVGIVISLSSTGILTAFALLLVFFMLKLRKGFSKQSFAIVITLIPVALIVLFNTSLPNYFMNRFEISAGYRFRSEETLPNFTTFSVIFGESMGYKAGFYMTGFLRLFAYFGILGIILFFIGILKTIKNNKSIMLRSLVVVFLILNIGTELLFQSILLPYFAIIIALSNKSLDQYKNEEERSTG